MPPPSDFSLSTAALIQEARAQVANQIQIATGLDSRGLGLLAAIIALIGAVLGDRPQVKLDAGADLVVAIWALLLLALAWLLLGLGQAVLVAPEYSRGPSVETFYDEFAYAPPEDFNRELLSALNDVGATNEALSKARRSSYRKQGIRLVIVAVLGLIYLAVVR